MRNNSLPGDAAGPPYRTTSFNLVSFRKNEPSDFVESVLTAQGNQQELGRILRKQGNETVYESTKSLQKAHGTCALGK